MAGSIRIVSDWDGYIVYITDYETGSDTSWGVDSRSDAFEGALAWLGFDIADETR